MNQDLSRLLQENTCAVAANTRAILNAQQQFYSIPDLVKCYGKMLDAKDIKLLLECMGSNSEFFGIMELPRLDAEAAKAIGARSGGAR